MPNGLEGKTALVTGASKGIGKGIALELARAGCDVAVNYHSDAAGAEGTVAEIRGLGRRAFAVRANVGWRRTWTPCSRSASGSSNGFTSW